ncbi:MAG: hydratase, partial [Bacillota bacterium]
CSSELAGDTPANNAFSVRHTTRNFPSREGSKPNNSQLSAVALMDARSVAATARNGGILTSATEFADGYEVPNYNYDDTSYRVRVYQGYENPNQGELIYGPNIKDWPEMSPLADHILLKVCSKIMDEVTTTDELIPSGETSSYRSNPLGLAEFTLSRRDPKYVSRTKAVDVLEKGRISGKDVVSLEGELKEIYSKIATISPNVVPKDIEIGSMIYCKKPGDGSAREQAASCQRVIGGLANICEEFATKRYRSNVMNWGMLPFQMKETPNFEVGDYIYVPNVWSIFEGDMQDIKAYVVNDKMEEITLYIAEMTPEEKAIVKAGCLINYNKQKG